VSPLVFEGACAESLRTDFVAGFFADYITSARTIVSTKLILPYCAVNKGFAAKQASDLLAVMG
jgi:hypothetical protein